MKIPKLAVLLPIAHFVIATVLIASHDSRYSRLELEAIDHIDESERQGSLHAELNEQHKTSRGQAFEESFELEYRQPADVKAVYGVELPAAALIGWFWHPSSAHSDGLLQPLLHRLTLGMPHAPKILLLDCLLILAICGQWFGVGSWLDYRVTRNKPAGPCRLAITITVAGVLSMILWYAGDWAEVLANLAALVAAIAWLGLLFGAAAGLVVSIRNLLSQAISPQSGLRA